MIQLGRTWLSHPITTAEILSIEILWHKTTVPEKYAKFHLTLQLKGQIESHFPEDPKIQSILLVIISPLANEVIDQSVPWILVFKMLTPERRAIFRHAILKATGLSATTPSAQFK